MSSIQSYVSELKNLNIELKRVNKNAFDIRKKIKEVEKNIIEYLREKEQPGVKYQDMAIIVENKTKRANKKKKDIEEDSIRILEENGIRDPKNVLDKILDARKGDEVENKKIKIKKLK
jgi:hypothetical protein